MMQLLNSYKGSVLRLGQYIRKRLWLQSWEGYRSKGKGRRHQKWT